MGSWTQATPQELQTDPELRRWEISCREVPPETHPSRLGTQHIQAEAQDSPGSYGRADSSGRLHRQAVVQLEPVQGWRPRPCQSSLGPQRESSLEGTFQGGASLRELHLSVGEWSSLERGQDEALDSVEAGAGTVDQRRRPRSTRASASRAAARPAPASRATSCSAAKTTQEILRGLSRVLKMSGTGSP